MVSDLREEYAGQATQGAQKVVIVILSDCCCMMSRITE